MAKKKPGKTSPKSKAAPSGRAVPELPDLRALEAAMRQFLGETAGKSIDTPLDRAQELVSEAFGVSDPRERAAMAHQALEISPDCADAYVLLAELAGSRKEALVLYRKGVEAGERALGPAVFEDHGGEFWGLLETRPYMRARMGLAELLWVTGHRDEAIAHLEAMLRLNPGDNQGVRYTLSGWLLNMDRFDDLARLLTTYQEESAAWSYTEALLAFRREGDVPASRKLLNAARRLNAHVPDYLLGDKPMPREPPPYYQLGDEGEAILYAASAMGGWRAIPGAMGWLKDAIPKPKAKAKSPRRPRSRGPQASVLKQLNRLPQTVDVWQVDFHQLQVPTEIDGEPANPWIVIALSLDNGLVMPPGVLEVVPSANQVWDALAEAMKGPIVDEPHRPTTLQVRAGEVWDELRPHLEAIGINVEAMEELDHLDPVLNAFEQEVTGQGSPGLLEVPGVDREQVAGFYEAAAEFYRSAPWRKLGYESAIRVECDRLDSGPRYAVVMGQSGLTFGLTLYDDLETLNKLWSSQLSDEENARETVALTVTFDDDSMVADADLDAIEQYEWEIVGPEAYPSIFRKERGMSMRPPLGWELELMQACLRTIPKFLDVRPLDDLSAYEATVAVPSGPLRLTLSWVES